MNIVVVGASGYAGRHIVEQAHRRGHRVRAVVRDRLGLRVPGRGVHHRWRIG